MTTATRSVRNERLALDVLDRWGLLLVQDAKLPNLAETIVGSPVVGSWWAHPRSREIFRAASALESRRDVLAVKLVDGKVTFVHARFVAWVVAVGLARERWQVRGLSSVARVLLEQVDAEGRLRASGAAAKQLEHSLLVASESVHTESGKHVTELISWTRLARDRAITRRPTSTEARAGLESLLRSINAFHGGRARLPWERIRSLRPR